MKTTTSKRGPTKGTTLKYSKVIKELKQMTTPTKISSPEFSKKHNVSTNLMIALQRMGHISNDKHGGGYIWNSKTKGSDVQIAEKARVMMNEMTNNRKPTRERPTGKRAYNGRKTGPKKAAKKVSMKKVSMIPTKRAYNKRVPTAPTNAKMQLAKKFSDLGEYEQALKLLS